MSGISTVGIAGTGLIGSGWAARLLARGHDVIAYDPVPAAEGRLKAAIEIAWPATLALLGERQPKPGRLTFTTDLKSMASGADFIQEAAPEREDLKIALFRDVDAASRGIHCADRPGQVTALVRHDVGEERLVQVGVGLGGGGEQEPAGELDDLVTGTRFEVTDGFDAVAADAHVGGGSVGQGRAAQQRRGHVRTTRQSERVSASERAANLGLRGRGTP